MDEEVQRFRPTNGRLTGVLGWAICIVIAVTCVLSGSTRVAVAGVLGSAFGAVLVWAAMLRPGVSASSSELRMRTLFESVTIPLASIETVVVRRFLLVRSGGNTYICPAIGRSLRRTVRSEMKWSGGRQILAPGLPMGDRTEQAEVKGEHDLDYPDFVEQQIERLAANDRGRRGIEERSEEEYELGSQVQRRLAWPEIAGLVVLGVGFVVALVV